MGIVAWLIFGLIAGAIAQLLLPGNDPGGGGFAGVLITIVIGVVGAVVGGFIGSVLGFGGVTEFDFRSMAVAVLGAVVLLLLWRAVARGFGGRRGLAH